MEIITFGVFSKQENAEKAINELGRSGFSTKDISIIMKDQGVTKEFAKTTENNVMGGVSTGITTGGILGGIAGLLIGIGAIIIPGIGGVIIGGPIAVALGLTGTTASTVSGVLTGVLAGGLLGGLIGLGLPESEARIYETDIKTGAVLLGVPSTELTAQTVKEILERNEGSQIRTVSRK